MCGRFSRSRNALDYIEPLMSDFVEFHADAFRPGWNIAPSTRQPIIRPDSVHVEHWGYLPTWAKARKMPPMINARLDKAATSTWKGLYKAGRVIVPADGWYEWVVEQGAKQPYYIQPIDGQPLYFAALSSVRPDGEPHDGDGFVIVTDAADSGLIDVHDRKPLVLTPTEAREWLNPAIDFEAASHLAHNAATKAESFKWYRVDKAVGNVRNNAPTFNEALPSSKILI